jgi:ribosome maturation factor RimP
VFIDSDGGVDLDTVAEVSEEISRGLDLRDPLPGRYTLEVSSPGLERNLRRPEHFVLSVGGRVVVKTSEKLRGNSHRLEGEIVEANDAAVRIAVREGTNGEARVDVVEVPYDGIKTARTVFEWS